MNTNTYSAPWNKSARYARERLDAIEAVDAINQRILARFDHPTFDSLTEQDMLNGDYNAPDITFLMD